MNSILPGCVGDLSQDSWKLSPFTSGQSTYTYTVKNPWTVKLTDNMMILSIDLPGVQVDDINLEIVDKHLILNAIRHDINVQIVEKFQYTSLYDVSSIEASFQHCVLTVSISKLPEVKTKIKIDVKQF